MWHDLVHMGIPVGEKAVRTAAVYGGLLVLLHLAGKRQLAQLNSFDLVVLLLLSNVVQNAVIGNDDSLVGGLLGATILIALNHLLVRAAFMSPRFGKALQGGATTLYENGRVDRRALRRQAITLEELVAGVRRQGLELEDVERVDLEPEGTFNVTPRPKPGIEDVLRRLDELEQRLLAGR
ncbi:MAG: DUF421 domain-containing protein [Thermoleophilia bacterium]|nr:DUF421 domain-containing protein [Thermoleophilia bacterium]